MLSLMGVLIDAFCILFKSIYTIFAENRQWHDKPAIFAYAKIMLPKPDARKLAPNRRAKPPGKTMPNYFGYLRVSTDSQDVDSQKLGLLEYACWRALNFDHSFALNFDQGWRAG